MLELILKLEKNGYFVDFEYQSKWGYSVSIYETKANLTSYINELIHFKVDRLNSVGDEWVTYDEGVQILKDLLKRGELN